MKVSELYNEVALLGFENDIDEAATFYPALNTALHTVLRMIPQKKRAILAHYPLTPLVSDTDKYLRGGEELSYIAEGAKSFYLEISGKGSISYKTYDFDNNVEAQSTSPTEWDNPYGYKVVRFLFGKGNKYPAKVKVTINAEEACKIRCLAFYQDIKSNDIKFNRC